MQPILTKLLKLAMMMDEAIVEGLLTWMTSDVASWMKQSILKDPKRKQVLQVFKGSNRLDLLTSVQDCVENLRGMHKSSMVKLL